MAPPVLRRSSLLRLQAAAITEPRAREMFEETENRIRSMALVHEKLYQSTDLSRSDLADYIRSLADLLLRSSAIAPDIVTIEVTGSEVFLGIDEAVPCGLIVNELLSNTLKHAFPNHRRGHVEVQLIKDADGSMRISVRDDGVGLPAQFRLDRAGTLGLQLVQGLVQQIDGTIEVQPRDAGAEFRVLIPGNRGTNVPAPHPDR